MPGWAGTFKVPQYIIRVDIDDPGKAGTHGWQVRYAKPSTFFGDHVTRKGLRSPKESLAEAKRHLASVYRGPPNRIRNTPTKRKTSPIAEAGIRLVTRQPKGKNFTETYVEATPPTKGMRTKKFYVGTSNTATEERLTAAIAKARVARKLMVAEHLYQAGAAQQRPRKPGRPVVSLDDESLCMRWISRMEASWRVWLNYKDIDSGQVYFYDSQYGSSQEALKQAQAYRDAFVTKYSIPLRTYTGEGFYARHSKNKGNLVGVNLSTNSPDNPSKSTKIGWTGCVQKNGLPHRKHWSVKKYGYTEAWRKAAEYRCNHTGEPVPKGPPKPQDWLKKWARLNDVEL